MTDRSTAWHPSEGSLADYADGSAPLLVADSIEAHLLRCGDCRAAFAVARDEIATTPTVATDATWAAVADRIDQPSVWSRARHWWVRVTLGSPVLAAASVGVVAVLVLLPLLVAAVDVKGGATVFIAVAPLAPVAGAALAFRPEVDPAGTLTAATPLGGARLVIVRAAVLAVVTLPTALAVAVAVPAPTGLLIGWILPGLGLALLVLAVGTRVDPARLAIGLGTSWAVAVGTAASADRRAPLEELLRGLFVNQVATQVVAIGIGLVAGAVLLTRRDHVWSR